MDVLLKEWLMTLFYWMCVYFTDIKKVLAYEIIVPIAILLLIIITFIILAVVIIVYIIKKNKSRRGPIMLVIL